MDTKYLIKQHNTYSVVVEIPKRLQAVAGQKRFKVSLKTGNLAEANRLKHSHVAEFLRRIDALEKSFDPKALVMKDAKEWRAELATASKVEDEEYGASIHGELLDQVKELSRQLAEKDEALAQAFHQTATGEGTLLKDLYPTWIAESTETGQTKSQHGSTTRRFIKWAGEFVTVEETDRKKAGEYVSDLIANSPLARRTIKRHLSSLSSLWQWLESKGYVKQESNPWLRHKLGKPAKGKPRYRKVLEEEALLRLLNGRYSTPRYAQVLHDMLRLALLQGGRLDELCAMKRTEVHRRADGYWLEIASGKTDAAIREIPAHPLAVPIIERRLRDKDTYLFKGLLPGGPDSKRSWYVSKAYGRYRNSEAVDVKGRGRDFHALRNTFISYMEGLKVAESTVKLLVGHERVSMTYGHYSDGQRVDLPEAMRALKYGPEVMQAIKLKMKPA
ncbi:MAG: tyrosine-type recombinase/integrase [Rhizobiales bacterium]|nr:tyrosine-type recombinase/integrase [Hyphomicrobiales bacterium]